MSHRTCWAIVPLVFAIASSLLEETCRAQGPPQPAVVPGEIPVEDLTLAPRPEPDPPLKYSLIPAYADLQPGNAATCYYRAILLLPREQKMQYGDEQTEWDRIPLKDFPKDQARAWLEPYRNSLAETRIATFREYCHWDFRIRELKGTAPFAFLLPELQETRAIARVLRVKSRLEISEGRFDDALETLTMGYRLAANVAESPILIGDLVGIAIASIMNQTIMDWIEAGGPNLYWALAGLPDPLVDTRPALQQEMHLPLQVLPFLKDPEAVSHTPDQWRQIIGESLLQMSDITGSRDEASNLAGQAMATGLMLAGYPAAKRQLVDSGMDPKRVEEMPVGQVVAIQTARVYHKVYQESMKWTLLPYWQSYRQMRTTYEELRSGGYFGQPGRIPGVIPIAALLSPAIEPATFAPVRMQREIAVLQTIEAIRMAAADANGQLPVSLGDLQQCPTPIDPLTGQLIEYECHEGRAVLTLAPPEGRSAEHFGKKYVLTLGKPAEK